MSRGKSLRPTLVFLRDALTDPCRKGADKQGEQSLQMVHAHQPIGIFSASLSPQKGPVGQAHRTFGITSCAKPI